MGYDDGDITWEPKENLDCQDLMKAFKNKPKAEQANCCTKEVLPPSDEW